MGVIFRVQQLEGGWNKQWPPAVSFAFWLSDFYPRWPRFTETQTSNKVGCLNSAGMFPVVLVFVAWVPALIANCFLDAQKKKAIEFVHLRL